MKHLQKRYLGLAAGVMMLAGTAVPYVATAQQTGGPAAPAAQAGQKHAGKRHQGDRISQLAATLGISEQKLRDAIVQTRAHALAQRLAPIVGISADTLQSGLTQGKSLAQIASDNGKKREDVRAAILAARDKHLTQAVAKGRLTTDQANARRQPLAQHVDKLLDRNLQQPGGRKQA